MELIITSAALVLMVTGALIVALVVKAMYGDSSAAYRLFAVRDQLIRILIDGKVDSEDPWFRYTYEQLNSLLHCSHMLSGTEGWRMAKHAGRLYGAEQFLMKNKGSSKTPSSKAPDTPPPPALIPVLKELDRALDVLMKSHMGFVFLYSSAGREYRRLYRAQARELDDSVNQGLRLVAG